ncbi:MAG: LacI family transcriptional regulator [Chloroflexota bacterium]|nr:MAG: LacI family transcriptional regulator [Chloroflexota bacterium]
MRRKFNRITIRDIAQELGITAMTVSRALNNKPDISPETKERVIETARRLQYVQSALGQGLASGYARAVGCVVTTLADPFAGRILEGIESVAREAGFALIVVTSQADPERQRMTIVDTFNAYRVGGIIVMCSHFQQQYFSDLIKLKSPIVLINSEGATAGANSVRIDEIHVARLAVTHLVELGHRRIAHLKVAADVISGQARWVGYRQTLIDHGLPCDDTWTIETENSEAGGAAATRQLLELDPRPTAIFCYNDRTAVGALAALRQAGVNVPAAMSVVGVDNTPVAEWVTPPLTTVRQPARQMGRLAMERILHILRGDGEMKDIVLPGELIIRESTAPPPQFEARL